MAFRVGGVVSETSFKFFTQFVAWTAIYCIFNLIVVGLAASKARRLCMFEFQFHGSKMLGTVVEAGPTLVILSDRLRGQKDLISCACARESLYYT